VDRYDIFDRLTQAIREVEMMRNESVNVKKEVRILEAACRDVLDSMDDIVHEYMLPGDDVDLHEDDSFVSD